MFFIQPTAATVRAALAAWDWLPLDGKSPFAVTAMGDVFFSDDKDASVWFLDRLQGQFSRAAKSEAALQQLLNTEDGQNHYLFYALLDEAAGAALMPEEDQCYDFKQPPILGGEVALGNLRCEDFETVLHISGQLHAQIKDLPPGTEIEKIVLE